MDRLSLLLSFAIVWLSLSYLLFTNQQYFSVISMLIIFAMAAAAFVVFLFTYKYTDSGSLVSSVKTDRRIVLLLIVITAFVVFEIIFNNPGPSSFGQIAPVLLLVFGGVAISIVGIYLLKRATKGMGSYKIYIAVIFGAIIITAFAYGLMYGLRSVNWNGIDELAYNYYASYLFVHGTNPYTASMQPILQQKNIFPTVQLNGTFEYAYDYPALSFLPYSFMPLLGISNFFVFIMVAVFFSILAAFAVYRKSGYNNLVLIPLAVWLAASYTLIGTSNQYIAVSIIFLLAYLERKRALLSGMLLGMAASIIQLVWFAIPFFFVLILRENGSEHMLKCIGGAVIAFILINSYFIIISPLVFTKSIFAVFGLTKLVFYGPNIMQLLVSHYPVASWYSAAISMITLLAFLVLYYFYTKTLKPLVAILPAMIFFLSWRNISIYGLPFIPVILAIYYVHDKGADHKLEDLIKSKKRLVYSVAFLAVLFVAMAVYSHSNYTKKEILSINSITPILYGQAKFQGPFGLGGIRVNVANNGNTIEPVSFYVVSRDPSGESYLLSQSMNATSGPQFLLPGESYNYTLQYQLQLVGNNTRMYIFAFSPDYIATKEYAIDLVPPASN
jgi:uncharacterized membrane protein